MKPALVVAVNDTHINSSVALAPPEFDLDDGGVIHQSKAQRWLWACWLDFWKEARKLARGRTVYVVANGDLVDLDVKDRSFQMLSNNEATVVANAEKVFAPAQALADYLFVLRGTEAHVGESGRVEELLAKQLKAVRDGKLYSRWVFDADFGGKRFNFAHHADGGDMVVAKNAPMERLAAYIRLQCAERDEKLPDYAVRAHGHFYRDSHGRKPRAIMLPSFQLDGAYGHRLGKGLQLVDHVGGGFFLIDRVTSEFIVKKYQTPARAVWKA